MSGRKKLNGIANGLLGTFVSRNNDIHGFWGLGVLRLVANCNGMSKLILDLTGRPSEFDADSPVKIAEETYHQWLFDRFAQEGIDRNSIETAEIHLLFSDFVVFPKAIRDTRGEPFQCSVFLENKCGVSCSATKIGVCAPHDPNKDRPSNRVVLE